MTKPKWALIWMSDSENGYMYRAVSVHEDAYELRLVSGRTFGFVKLLDNNVWECVADDGTTMDAYSLNHGAHLLYHHDRRKNKNAKES